MIRYIIFWLFFWGFICTRLAGDKRRPYEWGWGLKKYHELDH